MSSRVDWRGLAAAALRGELISREECHAVLSAPDDCILDQVAAAYQVRRHFWGRRVRLHFLLNAQSGLCPEDCHYCSQSKIWVADIDKSPLVATARILEAAETAARLHAGTLCLVISGRSPGQRVFDKLLEAIGEVKARHDVRICACLGLLNDEQAARLKQAGVTQVNHNLNTSESFTPSIVTTHTFADRRATVEAVKRAGLKTCSGGIVGLGESDDDVIDLALSLRDLEVRSVPVNFLIPIPGTPLAEVAELDPRRCLRVLCLFRFLLPSQEIRIAGGREVHLRSLQPLGLYVANSIFIGDYLTTAGQQARLDLEMIRDLGFVLEAPDGSELAGDPLAGLVDTPSAGAPGIVTLGGRR